MKLIKATAIKKDVTYQTRERRRREFLNLDTLTYPPDIGDGPPDEVIRLELYDGVETLELKYALTEGDENDWTIEIEGNTYNITERIWNGMFPDVWEKMICSRAL